MEIAKIEYLIKYYLHLLPLEEKQTIKYPYLNQYEKNKEEVRLANLIIKNYSDKIELNNCPNCGNLARTPKAKQCRFCMHNWR